MLHQSLKVGADSIPSLRPHVFLFGAGVVGRAILRAHVDPGVSICLIDQDEAIIRQAITEMPVDSSVWEISPIRSLNSGSLNSRAWVIELIHRDDSLSDGPPIIIESIAEKLDIKREFFASAEKSFVDSAILCTNTSTLRIGDLSAKLQRPQMFCGMHFFMPVDQRLAVEVVHGEQTSESTIQRASEHVRRIGKEPLVVGDGPGFIVNRLLSPYLNEAMLLLGRGVSAEQIERAALKYGMPMSPLELIDWIGTRTVFDAGRVFWQAFPDRISPSPIAPALLKRKRFGRANGAGFYDYVEGVRSRKLSPSAVKIVDTYRTNDISVNDQEVMEILSIPMWIEAALAYRQGIAHSSDQFQTAISGGLGFNLNKSWLGFFDSMQSRCILDCSKRWSPTTAALALPNWIAEGLRSGSPSEVLTRHGSAW